MQHSTWKVTHASRLLPKSFVLLPHCQHVPMVVPMAVSVTVYVPVCHCDRQPAPLLLQNLRTS